MAIYDASANNSSKRNNRRYRDIDLNFGRNPVTNDIAKVEDVNAVKRSVRNLIQTNFYERPFHPELGSGIRDLLFEKWVIPMPVPIPPLELNSLICINPNCPFSICEKDTDEINSERRIPNLMKSKRPFE